MNKIIQILSPIFIFTLLVFFSWILIHLLTIFGVFLAIAYPIWWIIAPKQTVCIFCRSRHEGEVCLACHEVVHKSEGTSPKTFMSAVYNGLVFLVFTIISIGIVFLESQILFHFGFPQPAKTISFAVPSQQDHEVGEFFPMQIKITGIKQAINSVRVDFSYNPSQIAVVDISTKGSFANIFIQKQIDNKAGIARFAGGLPNPGFSGKDGIFATVYLEGLKEGITSIHFLPSSVVLANDGRGDNLLSSLSDASYLIVPKIPNRNTNYKQTDAKLETKVLGSSTSTNMQMIFYNEGQVLSDETSPTVQQSNENNTNNSLFSELGNIDKDILAVWSNIFH